MVKIPKAIAYKDKPNLRKTYTREELNKLPADSPVFKHLYCPWKKCMARLTYVISKKTSYLRTIQGKKDRPNSHIKGCWYAVHAKNKGKHRVKRKIYYTDSEMSGSMMYAINKLRNRRKSYSHHNKAKRYKPNNISNRVSDESDGQSVLDVSTRDLKYKRSVTHRHYHRHHKANMPCRMPDTLNPKYSGELTLGGYLTNVELKDNRLLLTVSLHNVSKTVMSRHGFFKQQQDLMTDIKASKDDVAAYLKKHRVIIGFHVDVMFIHKVQYIFVNKYDEMSFWWRGLNRKQSIYGLINAA